MKVPPAKLEIKVKRELFGEFITQNLLVAKIKGGKIMASF